MTEEEKIKEEIAFTDYWFTELGKTTTPTFADAIEWAEERQRKIDVDKACEVFDRLMMDYEQDRKSHDECLEEMRKAMMED